ncbi:hypothetical protein F4803DRAFT_290807 [Xylaria telfairii]|nr:hypothetical protein F4803DRAFT_290807 [Xylaria telfairii]
MRLYFTPHLAGLISGVTGLSNAYTDVTKPGNCGTGRVDLVDFELLVPLKTFALCPPPFVRYASMEAPLGPGPAISIPTPCQSSRRVF